MAVNTVEIFPKTLLHVENQLTAANTALDGTGLMVRIFTGTTNGARLDRFNAKAIASSVAGMIRFFRGTLVVSGTAQAGGANTITLAAGSSSTDSFYNNQQITITSGTGSGQTRCITGYVGVTKVATVNSNWTTQPDATSVYDIVQCRLVHEETVDARTIGASTAAVEITLAPPDFRRIFNPNEFLYVSTEKAETFNVDAEGGDFTG